MEEEEDLLTVGVLALQGSFDLHCQCIEALGAIAYEVREAEDLELCDGLIIPGGESTTISSQIEKEGLQSSLLQFAQEKPLFGTCAGLILMAHDIHGYPGQFSLDLIDISVLRNAYGRQVDSFETLLNIDFPLKKSSTFPAIFIRAPRIKEWNVTVKVLAKIDDEPVLIQQGKHLGATFHPELSHDLSIHEYFLNIVRENQVK